MGQYGWIRVVTCLLVLLAGALGGMVTVSGEEIHPGEQPAATETGETAELPALTTPDEANSNMNSGEGTLVAIVTVIALVFALTIREYLRT